MNFKDEILELTGGKKQALNVVDDETISQISLYENEELQIRKKRIYNPKPPFLMFGSGEKNKSNGESMNAARILGSLNPKSKELKVLIWAIEHRDKETNIILEPHPDMTSKDYSNGASKLIKLNLFSRVRRGVFRINPKLIIPFNNFDETETFYISERLS